MLRKFRKNSYFIRDEARKIESLGCISDSDMDISEQRNTSGEWSRESRGMAGQGFPLTARESPEKYAGKLNITWASAKRRPSGQIPSTD